MKDLKPLVGTFVGDVVLETCRDNGISRPRVKPVTVFGPDIRVEFPRRLRELFPVGTQFQATVKVCQKTSNGQDRGDPYLKAYDVAVVASSVPDEGLLAQVTEGSISGLSYEYVWRTKSQ